MLRRVRCEAEPEDTGPPSALPPAGRRARRRLQRRQRPSATTLARLPDSFATSVDHVLVCDDASTDDTYEVGLDFKESSPLPITVVTHERNLGYGGNQKAGYEWAIEHGLDVVVLLHGDGQYAPEVHREPGRAAASAARPTRSSAPG